MLKNAKVAKRKSGFSKVLLGVALAAVSTVVAFVVTSIMGKNKAIKNDQEESTILANEETTENYITLNDDETPVTEEEVVDIAEEAFTLSTEEVWTDETVENEEEKLLIEDQPEDDQEEDVTACIK